NLNGVTAAISSPLPGQRRGLPVGIHRSNETSTILEIGSSPFQLGTLIPKTDGSIAIAGLKNPTAIVSSTITREEASAAISSAAAGIAGTIVVPSQVESIAFIPTLGVNNTHDCG